MKKKMLFLCVLFLGAGMMLYAAGRQAGEWPTRAVTIVVPFNPGGDSDFNARAYATRLQPFLGRPVVVQNMAGAGGALASRHMRTVAPDGYTLLLHHVTMFVNYATGANDFGLEAFDLAAIVGRNGGSLVAVNANSPFHTLRDLMEASLTASPPLTFAANIGASTYVMASGFNRAGGRFNLVDLGDATERIGQLMGGHVTAIPNAIGTIIPFLQSGDFRALAIIEDERNPFFPDIPTAREQGFDVSLPILYFMAFPRGTPSEIVERFTDALEQVSQMPDYQAEIRDVFMQAPFFQRGEAARQWLMAQQAEILAMREQLVTR